MENFHLYRKLYVVKKKSVSKYLVVVFITIVWSFRHHSYEWWTVTNHTFSWLLCKCVCAKPFTFIKSNSLVIFVLKSFCVFFSGTFSFAITCCVMSVNSFFKQKLFYIMFFFEEIFCGCHKIICWCCYCWAIWNLFILWC